MKRMSFIIAIMIAVFASTNCAQQKESTGNVIFIHPDGTGLATWNAARILHYGLDGQLNWDKLSNVGLYKGHLRNTLASSSNGGGTVHAYGIKAFYESYGMDPEKRFKSASGKEMSIMNEAMEKGIAVGVVNSGSIIEPGTGVFLSNESKRSNYESITKQIIQSGADVILSGGEEWMLPQGVKGRFVESGSRTDNLNLIEYAQEKGYTIVYTREELLNIPKDTKKLLGVFAKEHTFNDETEEDLKKGNTPNYKPGTPTLAEMTKAAIEILSKHKQFFLVVEEEATDNFANKNNANGVLEALKRADDAIGIVYDFIGKNQNTLLVTAADSEAGGMEIIDYAKDEHPFDQPLPEKANNGAPLDGVEGTMTLPFISKKDNLGNEYAFGIAWSTTSDVYGSVIAKAHGMNSEMMQGSVDNTFIYKIMYKTLFGQMP